MTIFGHNPRNNPRRAIVSLMVGVIVATIGALGALAQTPPPEDVCAGALLVTPGITSSGQTFNDEATNSPDDPELSCTMGPGFGSVYFTFVATETSARVRTDLNSVGLDADFAVYAVDQGDQCNTSLWDEVGCNEDGEFLFNGETCIEGLIVNNTYKIVLKSFTAGSSGDYTLQIESPCGAAGGGEPPPEDTEDPVVTAPDDINVNTDPGEPTAVVNFLDATATDNVGVDTLVQTAGPLTGSAFPIGLTVVTWTATDVAGNQASDSTDITVSDNEDPVISVPGNIVAEATSAAGAVVEFPFATATDNSGGVIVTQTAGPASGSQFPLGPTTVSFQAVDPSGNTAQGSFTVTVEDTTPPDVTAPADVTKEATGTLTSVAIGTATALDLVDGTVAVTNNAPASFPIGTTVVTWTATDTAVPPNVGTATQNVTLVYIFGQFLPPLEDGKIYKANRTLPVKFQITFVGGELAVEAIVEIQVVSLGKDDTPGEPIDLSTFETADTGSVFRFTDGQYIYNLSTKGFDPGMYRISAILSNGQKPFIDIMLR